MNRLTIGLALLALTGCATCDRHPVACGVAMTLVVGSLAANAGRHGTQADPDRQMSIPLTPNCSVYPEMCK